MTGIAEKNTSVSDEQALESFVTGIGSRVRELRQQKAISRRMLSELSGVSERYLAQLETGNGNISVALLFKIAGALNRRPGWFLDGSSEANNENELAQLMSLAPQGVKEQVLHLLMSSKISDQKKQRFCMIGLRGAGKSTLGKYAARKLGFEFLELNEAIEKQAGMPVGEIMALYGQEGYRKLELDALSGIVESRSKVVVAVGGGIVSEPETFRQLLANFHTVWIKAAPQEHMDRVRDQGDQRPMAGNPRAMEELKSILISRERLYSQADLKFDSSGKTLTESKAGMLNLLRGLEASTQPVS